MRTQIVAARAVAEVIADVLVSPWAGAADPIEVAGPREEDMVALAILLAEHRGAPWKVEGVCNPADPDAEMQATGGLPPGPAARLVGPMFEVWLDQH